jgi:hypothetical protein
MSTFLSQIIHQVLFFSSVMQGFTHSIAQCCMKRARNDMKNANRVSLRGEGESSAAFRDESCCEPGAEQEPLRWGGALVLAFAKGVDMTLIDKFS